MTAEPPPVNWTGTAASPSTRLICLLIVTVCAVGAVATTLRTVITPLLIAILLLYLVSPLVQTLDRYRTPRWLTYVLLCVIGSVALFGIGWIVESQGRELRDRLPEYRQRTQEALDKYAKQFGLANREGRFDTRRYSLEDVLPGTQDELVKYVLEATIEILELFSMAFFYLLFALMETRHLPQRMQRALSSESASHITRIFESITHEMQRYLWVKTAISAGMGLTTAALGWMFGLDFWLLWGFLMFLANYVTYIGSIAALIPPMLVALAQFDSMLAAGSLCALLVVARLVWIDYVEIRYSGQQVNVSPLLVLFSVALLGWMWGAVGMLLAVPLVTITRIVLDSQPRTRFMAALISDVHH